jgi:hypothetical protein
VGAERGADADAHASVPHCRGSREARHVARCVTSRCEEAGHHDDLARAPRHALRDRLVEARAYDREVCGDDLAAREAAGQRARDRAELPIRCPLAAAVIDEHDGAACPPAHQ